MIDLNELALAIRNMTRQQAIYKVLKTELGKQGYWHNLKRGNPAKGFQAMQDKRGQSV